MADIIGFDHTTEKEHRLSNPLDGKLDLIIYVNKAKGDTVVYVNGSETNRLDAGNGASPFCCGTISLPRGEFVLSVSSECEIERILLSEALEITSAEEFELNYANRKGQWVFERPQPEYTPEMLASLRRHGFLFDEPGDCAVGKMPSGIPLGGFGCGKLEICENGLFTAFTGNNNQDSPIYRMPGSFMAMGSGKEIRILQSDPMGLPYKTVSSIEADPEFPFARLHYSDPSLPVTASLEAFSPHIPGNAADSALPCIFFDVTLKNISNASADCLFCFSWENIINVGGSMSVTNKSDRVFPLCFHTWNGSFVWSDRRKNSCVRDKDSLVFEAKNDCGNPMSFGKHMLYCSDESAEALTDRSILPDDEARFADYLSGSVAAPAISCDSEFRAGAWIVRRRLSSGEACTVRFILAWYMPTLTDAEGTDHSVWYTNRFANVYEVMRYAAENHDRLYRETAEFNALISRASLPDWFKRRLLDNRFVVSTCSWYDKAGNFSINEAPTGMGGCLGTLDQRTASQCYYTAFFPALDKLELDLFRRAQAEDGMCAHEIGFAGIKLWARPFSKWPDLVAAYIIQVYHHYQRTGDKEMLLLHWPHIKKAVEWTLTLDDTGCGIPFICPGRGTTYDNQFWEGINAFIATMQIASYRLGSVCAALSGEKDIADKWEKMAEKAHSERMSRLWDEKRNYFFNAYNPKNGNLDQSCFIAALAGEWAELRAGIAPYLPEELIASAASAITAECIGENGLTDQGGRKNETDGFTQYPLAYLASPAIYCGNLDAAVKVAEITERVITQEGVSNHFNQALTYSYHGKRYGLPYYMTAPASWNILEALAGLRADLGNELLSLAPYGNNALRLPVFLPNAWFDIIRAEDGNTLSLVPIKSLSPCSFRTVILKGAWNLNGIPGTLENGNTVFHIHFDPGLQTLNFTKTS